MSCSGCAKRRAAMMRMAKIAEDRARDLLERAKAARIARLKKTKREAGTDG